MIIVYLIILTFCLFCVYDAILGSCFYNLTWCGCACYILVVEVISCPLVSFSLLLKH